MTVEEKSNVLEEADKAHLWHAMHGYNPESSNQIAVKGEGSWFWDQNGDKYMDGVSGLWCLNLGHGRKEMVDAASEQLMSMSYFPLTFSHAPAIKLSTKISELLGDEYTTFFANSGSESNETAFKIARQYHQQTGNPGKYKFISRYRAYHGTTLGALSATAQASRKTKYDPTVPGFVHVPPPYSYRSSFGENVADDSMQAAEYMEQVINWEGEETVAAVILEPFISGGGVLVPSKEYLTKVAEICKRHNVLLIVDEVVSGFGRTGKMFGFMHSDGVQPDIVTMAKGLTSGYLPLGATAVRSDIYQKFNEGGDNTHLRHVSTFGGNPASCALALKSLEIVEREDIPGRVAQLDESILSKLHGLEKLDKVGEVRNAGFLYGIELVEDKQSKTPAPEQLLAEIMAECKQNGLVISKNGDTIPGHNNILIIAPPLSSTEDDLYFLVDTVQAAVEKYCG